MKVNTSNCAVWDSAKEGVSQSKYKCTGKKVVFDDLDLDIKKGGKNQVELFNEPH